MVLNQSFIFNNPQHSFIREIFFKSKQATNRIVNPMTASFLEK